MTTQKDAMPDEMWFFDNAGGKTYEATDKPNNPFAFKYHHERIIKAKDAEIATLKAERDLLARSKLGECTAKEQTVAFDLARKIVKGE